MTAMTTGIQDFLLSSLSRSVEICFPFYFSLFFFWRLRSVKGRAENISLVPPPLSWRKWGATVQFAGFKKKRTWRSEMCVPGGAVVGNSCYCCCCSYLRFASLPSSLRRGSSRRPDALTLRRRRREGKAKGRREKAGGGGGVSGMRWDRGGSFVHLFTKRDE